MIIDFVPIILFFIGGRKLLEHNPKSRKWIIGFSGLVIALSIVLLFYTLFYDIPTGLRVWNYEITENIKPLTVYLLSMVAAIVFTSPFFLLRTKRALEEFAPETIP